MTTFLDGPAVGVTLGLRRAPLLLRVVCNAAGEWDALDQLDDTPGVDETVVVYRMVRGPWRMHVNRSRRHGGCAWFCGGEYRVLEAPPADEVVRSNAAWQAWAHATAPTLPEPAA